MNKLNKELIAAIKADYNTTPRKRMGSSACELIWKRLDSGF